MMSLARALEIEEHALQADCNIGMAGCCHPSQKQIDAAQAVIDYHHDKEFNSAEGRLHRAKAKARNGV